MKCPKCQFDNPNNMKFCGNCGTMLELVCPKCNFLNPPQFKFCGECGQDLSISSNSSTSEKPAQSFPNISGIGSLSDGERRRATIVFSDLSGYTSMNERLDPEEVEGIMSRIKKEAERIVENHGGTVNQFVGDEILALFGIPVAHEDDPIRAVRASLEIHRLVREMSPEIERRIETPLRMHTGINTGLIVTHLRDVREGQFGITGDAVNTGSRLASLASSDEIIVSPETQSLINPYFKTLPLEAVQIDVKSKPVILYRVIKKSEIQTRFEAAERKGFTAFTGRERELSALQFGLARSMAGNGQFVTVVGEAGIGKSRLVLEFRHSVDRDKVTVLQGRCQSYGSNIPYFPLVNALRRGLNLGDEEKRAELHKKAVANILAIDQTLEQYIPLYLQLLSIPSEDYPLPKHLHGQELKLAIQEALAAINIHNSIRKPMVLILEDWHWTDEGSDSALRHLVNLLSTYPLMVVIIYRPEYTASWPNLSHHTPIVLKPLDNRHTENIMKAVWSVDHLPDGFAPRVNERTGGNPFFVEEVCTALTEEGSIEIIGNKAILNGAIENLALPATVQAVIRARLDRLDQYSREALQLASVIGREFALQILERISISKNELNKSLEILKFQELIQQIRLIPEAEYMFKHVLTQEVTYETLLRQNRKNMHGLVGQAIEELYQDRIEEQVNLLFHHFSLAENWPKAAVYGQQAASKAYKLSQYQDALKMFEQAKKYLLKLPENPNRQEALIAMHSDMNWPLHFLGNHDRAWEICQESESVARSLANPVPLGKVFYDYAMTSFFKGRYEKAESYYLNVFDQLEGTGEDEFIYHVKFPLAVTYLSLAQWEKAAALYSEIIEISETQNTQANYRRHYPFLPYTHSCMHLGFIRALQGHIEEGKKLVDKGHTPHLESIANLPSKAYCTLWHSTLSALIGENYGALTRAEKVVEIAEKTDSPILCFLGYAAKGNALMASELYKEACGFYEEALEVIKGTEHRRYLASVYYHLIRSYLELGDIRKAEQYYQDGFPLVELNPALDAPRFDFVRARLLASSSFPDFEQSENFFEKSIQADENSSAIVPAAQSRYYLAQGLFRKGDVERSRLLFKEIREKFQVWGIPAWKRKCELMLKKFDQGRK